MPEVTPEDRSADIEMREILQRAEAARRAHRKEKRRSMRGTRDDARSGASSPSAVSGAETTLSRTLQRADALADHIARAIAASEPKDEAVADGREPARATTEVNQLTAEQSAKDQDPIVEDIISADSSVTSSTCAPEDTHDDFDELARTAHKDGMPSVCIVGPTHLDVDMRHEWNRFCRNAARVRALERHEPSRFCSDATCIGVTNIAGEFVVYNAEWTRWILHNRKTRALYALAHLRTDHAIESVEDLLEGHQALAYDPLCIDCQDAMLSWEYDRPTMHVIPAAHTPMQKACIVTRINQILMTCNIPTAESS